MPSRKTFLEALRALRDHEEAAEHGWVLLGMLRPDHHKAVERAAGQGLVELAGREMPLPFLVGQLHSRHARRSTGAGSDARAAPAD